MTLLELDIESLRQYIDELGVKQKAVADKSGVSEPALCLILQGKRRCEAGEYAGICKTLNVPMTKFMRPRLPDEKGA
ncbi:MAG: helix-turn-helix transcriptional regulator [Clostridium sp.]|nr:helix-turn-helix transcriptional regulator [Clostridium sp.]